MSMKIRRWLSKSSKNNDKSNEKSNENNYNGKLLYTDQLGMNTRQILDNQTFDNLHGSEIPVIYTDEMVTKKISNDELYPSKTISKESTREKEEEIRDIKNLMKPFNVTDASVKVFGYENFGNTCYCNSVLQCLYNIPELRNNILQYPISTEERKEKLLNSKLKVFDENSFDTITNNNYNNDITNSISNNSNRFLQLGQSTGNQSRINNLKFNYKSSSVNNSQELLSKPPSQIRNSFKSASSKEQPLVNSALNSGPTAASLVDSGIEAKNAKINSAAPIPITEKIHESTKITIVGRPKGMDVVNDNSNELKSYAEDLLDESGKYVDNLILTQNHISGSSSNTNVTSAGSYNDESNDNTVNIEIEYSTEQKKRAALIKGPVLNIDTMLSSKEGPNMYNALRDIFESITANNHLTGIVSPKELIETLKKENIMFNSTMHQDAHEFLNFLLNQIGDYIDSNLTNSIPGNSKFKRNFINDLFKGSLKNTTRCLTCDNITSRDEEFLDFAIEVSSSEETDISTILRDYSQREMLNGSNKFFCDCCCGLQEAERIVRMKELPHLLFLHLKRFKYSEEQNSNIKLFNKIKYPLELQVSSACDPNVSKWYDLTGIVVHLGGGPQHGHYVYICKTENYGWLLFDDEVVVSVTEESVLKYVGDSTNLTTAYVLLYTSKDEKLNAYNANENYEANIKQLLKNDDIVRNYVSKISALNEEIVKESFLEDVAEVSSAIGEKLSKTGTASKTTKRKSKLFSFGL